MMGFGNGAAFGIDGGLWVLGCILLVVGLVAIVAWAVSRMTPHERAASAPDRTDALEILRARFARGEISEADYTQAASVLRTDR